MTRSLVADLLLTGLGKLCGPPLQKVIVDQKLKLTRGSYSARDPGRGFCGKSFHALFGPRTLGSKKLCFARLGVQLVD
jgi:hypothetical protein